MSGADRKATSKQAKSTGCAVLVAQQRLFVARVGWQQPCATAAADVHARSCKQLLGTRCCHAWAMLAASSGSKL